MKHLSVVALLLLLVCGGCYKDVDSYIHDNRYSILSVKASPSSIPADGVSMAFLTATISSDANLKSVQFTTTKGHFLDSASTYTTQAAMVNNSLVASSSLVASQDTSSYIYVTVAVPGLDTVLNLQFVTALPDSIHVESATDMITSGFASSVPLQTRLFRLTGRPSLHQGVSFQAIRTDQSSIGNFIGISPNGSDSTGLINSTFVLADTSYTGTVKIISSFPTPAKLLTDTFTIYVIK